MTVGELPLVILVGRILLVWASVAATIFVLYYGLSTPWYRYRLGWVVMLQGMALALALNLKLVLTFFLDADSRPVLLWVNVGIVGTIAVTSTALIYIMWSIRRKIKQGVSR